QQSLRGPRIPAHHDQRHPRRDPELRARVQRPQPRVLRRPPPRRHRGPGDVVTAAAKIISIETKATGETMTVELNAANQKGHPVQKALFIAFIRGARNREAASSEPRAIEPDRGEPIFSVAQTIDKDQTYRYAEASGDRNPIHVDENIAKMAG